VNDKAALAATGATSASDKLSITASRQFTAWLAERQLSLAFTTYQAGKLFLIGRRDDERLSIAERTFNRCMGLWSDGSTLWLSTLWQLWCFRNTLDAGETFEGYDRLFIPRLAYTTGDVDIHDVGIDAAGRPLFVTTLFSCLATVSDEYSFLPLWMPKFVSKLAAEDRCHLNGLAMEDGQPRYVTAVSASDSADGWRDRRGDGGIAIDVASDEIVCRGLSMPHSPRLYRGRLWLLDSGSGYFGYVDDQTQRFEPVVFCPGYARGLTFVGDYAVVGLSRPRHGTFSGLSLDRSLAERNVDARCGLVVISLKTGDIVHWLRIEGIIEELYDVVALAGAQRPMAVGVVSDEIQRMLTPGPAASLPRPWPAARAKDNLGLPAVEPSV
jgi:uncharacterized protein (TIGR03032 family)